MRIDYQKGNHNEELSLCSIDLGHIAEELAPSGTNVTVQNLNRLARMNRGKCEGFKLMRGGYSVGTIWVMYKGSDDLEYGIRNIDAYIFDVFVNEKHRGNGYAGEMIRQLMEYLHKKGIESAHLEVAVSNTSAISAYKKTGFTTVKNCFFARIMKINIPYHAL